VFYFNFNVIFASIINLDGFTREAFIIGYDTWFFVIIFICDLQRYRVECRGGFWHPYFTQMF